MGARLMPYNRKNVYNIEDMAKSALTSILADTIQCSNYFCL